MKIVTKAASLILMIAILFILFQLLEPAAGGEIIWMAGLQVQRHDGVPACRCPEPIWIANCGCVVLD
jgi:hypothetical protein